MPLSIPRQQGPFGVGIGGVSDRPINQGDEKNRRSRISWEEVEMQTLLNQTIARSGKVGYLILWLLGVPIPILLLIFLLRGCN